MSTLQILKYRCNFCHDTVEQPMHTGHPPGWIFVSGIFDDKNNSMIDSLHYCEKCKENFIAVTGVKSLEAKK